ncbi:MAG: adenylyl-sulfate kinase [Flavobacteriales bacterium]
MPNLHEHRYAISSEDRASLKGHSSMLIWFTGLSGSGKSTLADALEKRLIEKKVHTYHLDGDSIRKGLNADLNFLAASRDENLRRVGEVSVMMLDAGLVVLAAFISPMRKQRDDIRNRVGEGRMLEVYVNTPIQVCEQRDVKGLYKKARAGEISDFTGVNAPYEEPLCPEVVVDTSRMTMEEAMNAIILAMSKKGWEIS